MPELILSFPDQSKSFSEGVEFGRLLEKIERGDDVIMNNGFPVRLVNVSILRKLCELNNYIPSFGEQFDEEWIYFIGMKKTTSCN